MLQAVFIDDVKRSAKACEAFKQMSEQVTQTKRVGRRSPLYPVCRHERDEMVGALDLLGDLGQYNW